VDNLQELETLSFIWDTLAANHNSYFPFLCFDWFKIWLKHFLKDDKLHILLLYKNKKPVAIAPFLINKEKFKGINVRKIELIGNVFSPIRCIFSIENAYKEKEENLNRIFLYFKDVYKDWDIIDLHSIIEEVNTLPFISDIVNKSGLANMEYFCFANWYAEGINYSSDLYFKNRSKNFQAIIRKNFNKAMRLGNLEFKMITDYVEVENHIKTYLDVYERSWKKREALGQAFLMDWIKSAAAKGWLRLGIVLLNEVAIGIGFGIVHGNCAYFQKTAYDEKYKEIGPGTIWYTEMIRYVIDTDKVETIDFLRGDEEQKKRWLEKKRERRGVLIFNENIKGYLLNFLLRSVLPTINNNYHLKSLKNLIVHKLFKTNQ